MDKEKLHSIKPKLKQNGKVAEHHKSQRKYTHKHTRRL